MVRLRNDAATTKQKRMEKVPGLATEEARNGQSVVAVCREQNLCAPHFFWWKKRLRKSMAVRFLEVQVAESAADALGESRIEVRLWNGRSLMVERGFDPGHVRALCAVMKAAG